MKTLSQSSPMALIFASSALYRTHVPQEELSARGTGIILAQRAERAVRHYGGKMGMECGYIIVHFLSVKR